MTTKKYNQGQWARFAPRESQRQSPQQREPSGLGGFLASVALTAAVIGLAVGAVFWVRATRPDPHYVRAVGLLDTYEKGKSPERRNYGNRAYALALEELVQVDPVSISSNAAHQLEKQIRAKIEIFAAQLEAEERGREKLVQARNERIAIEYEQRRVARANPRVFYPECETEKGHEGDGHSHTH